MPDINLLVYAYNGGAPDHEAAKRWREGLVNGSQRVGVPWIVATGFVRLMTHLRALTAPVSPTDPIALGSGTLTTPKGIHIPIDTF